MAELRNCLHEGARPDERFHLQWVEPRPSVWGWPWLIQRVTWENLRMPDDNPGRFTAWIVLWVLRWYSGAPKCDGSRTLAYRRRQLCPDDPQMDRSEAFVMTTTPKERISVRLRVKAPDHLRWDNMGGI